MNRFDLDLFLIFNIIKLVHFFIVFSHWNDANIFSRKLKKKKKEIKINDADSFEKLSYSG